MTEISFPRTIINTSSCLLQAPCYPSSSKEPLAKMSALICLGALVSKVISYKGWRDFCLRVNVSPLQLFFPFSPFVVVLTLCTSYWHHQHSSWIVRKFLSLSQSILYTIICLRCDFLLWTNKQKTLQTNLCFQNLQWELSRSFCKSNACILNRFIPTYDFTVHCLPSFFTVLWPYGRYEEHAIRKISKSLLLWYQYYHTIMVLIIILILIRYGKTTVSTTVQLYPVTACMNTLASFNGAHPLHLWLKYGLMVI